MGHRDFVVRGGQSPGYIFTFIRDVSAYFYVTPGSHIYTHYHREEKELLWRAVVMEDV